MDMRSRTRHIIIGIILLATGTGFAQRSSVFLPPMVPTASRYDRPSASLHKIRPLASLANQNITNFAPDFPNIDVSSFLLADQDETSIAINPTNPDNLIIGANDYRTPDSMFFFQSFDGGRSWRSGSLDPNWGFAADPTDPSVIFNTQGIAFYSYGRTAHDPHPINDVVCHRSSDGGVHWNKPVRVILDSTGDHLAATFADKYYIAVDNVSGSPFAGRLYESWVEYDLNKKDRVRLAYSSDDGLTWSQPVYLTSSGDFQSPIPTIGSGGAVYVTYENIDAAVQEIRFASSIDGGKTFSVDKRISGYTELGPLYPPGDPAAHPVIKGHVRVNSFPSIAVDHSSLHFGRIYICWTALGADNRAHIYLTMSDNAGSSWSNVATIEHDTSSFATDKFFPWIAVDDATGDVGIASYDSRSDTSNILTDLYMFLSHDGGQSFLSKRISSTSFDINVSGSTQDFFGDYNALAVHNKIWHPAWTDSRVGYDQEIYSSVVRPYAPSAPINFVALEDSASHLPNLRWGYSGTTTFGEPLGDYVFRLIRTDGGLRIDLPKNVRSFGDSQASPNTKYSYSLQVVTSTGDTSITVWSVYDPLANRKPLAPMITDAAPQPNSLLISYKVPDKNVAGLALTNLSKIYYLVNGVPIDSLNASDALRGKTFTHTFSTLPADGFYLIQLAAATINSENVTTLSALSPARWLYSGSPQNSYTENFIDSKNIFTPFAWDTTSANGSLPAEFINDSLPNDPYRPNTNTWFVLPPIAINPDAQTLEFGHIALVAPGDSALIEVSTNDGLDFSPLRFYDRSSHPNDWGNSLSQSRAAHEAVALKYLLGKNAVLRFRLMTQSSGGDGWFIDSIHTSNLLGVPDEESLAALRVELLSNPINCGLPAHVRISSDKASDITVNLYSMLGEKISTLILNTPVASGENELRFTPEESGCFCLEVISRRFGREERRFGKLIVLP